MEDNEIKALLIYFMDYFQRRRLLLQRQLIASHQTLLNNMALQRRKTQRQAFVVNNEVAAKFITENSHYVRFRERKKQRSEQFWHNLQATGNENLFYQHLRMSKNTFEQLCEKLAPQLKTNQPVLTPPLTVEKQLAICLYKLSTNCTYKEVGDTFGVSKSTVYKYFRATIEAIVKLKAEFVGLPAAKEALSIANGFRNMIKLPNLYGVIDYTHVPILPPAEESANFMNSKGWHSVALETVVDNKLLFRDICITPGGIKSIYKKIGLLQKCSQIISTTCITAPNNSDLPLMLIGDLSYPLYARLLKPYKKSLEDEEKCLNSHIESGLKISQHAFKQLKGRWQCLAQKIEINPDFVPSVIMACCILHNFLVLQKETFSDTWIQDIKESEHEFPQPINAVSTGILPDVSIRPFELRDRIKDYLNKNL